MANKTKIELILSGYSIDISNNDSLSLNYSIADIRDFSTRNSSYSKTIQFPGTKDNNNFFANIFEISSDISNFEFNPNRKIRGQILADSQVVFDGNFQLRNVINNNGDIYYEGVIYGFNDLLVKNIGNKMLSDLDLSQYNHSWSYSARTANWAETDAAYTYPIIDYYQNFTCSGGTIMQPAIGHNIYPAVKVKTILDAIFSGSNCTYTSNFLSSEPFIKLVTPHTNEIFASSLPVLSASTSVDIELPVIGSPVTPNYFNTTHYDNFYIFNRVTSTNNAVIKIPQQWSELSNLKFTYEFNYEYTGATQPMALQASFVQLINGALNTNNETDIIIPANITSGGTAKIDFVFNDFTPNSLYYLFLLQSSAAFGGKIVIKAGAKLYCPDTEITGKQLLPVCANGMVNLSDVLKSDVSQIDFFSGIRNHFGLMIENDKTNPTNYIIEPYTPFYTGGTVYDWTSKLDLSSPISSTFLPELTNKKIIVGWEQDDDYFNSDFKKKTNLTYGNKVINVDNDFVIGTKENLSIFSPTVMSDIEGNPNIVIPKIYLKDQNGAYSKTEANIRLLYYGGIVTGSTIIVDDDTQLVSYTVNGYPYAGDVDNFKNPTFDLNFDKPEIIYYNQTASTDNNVFNTYHKTYYESLISPNSKLVKMSFHLTPLDISTISFRDSIFVDGIYYKLNKIIGYNPYNNGITQVELIKSDATISLQKSKTRRYDSITLPTTLRLGNNISKSPFSVVIGEQNYLGRDSQYSIIAGKNNFVSASTVAIINSNFNTANTSNGINIIGGNNNYVPSGTSNVTMIGVTGYTALIDDIVVIPNLQLTNLTGNADSIIYTNTQGVIQQGIYYSALTAGTSYWSAGTGTQAILRPFAGNTAKGNYSLTAGKNNNNGAAGTSANNAYSTILNGVSNSISGNSFACLTNLIGNGYSNKIVGSVGTSILNGGNNYVYNVANTVSFSRNNLIGTGQGNIIRSGSTAVIINGVSNIVSNTFTSSIINGQNNTISGTSTSGTIVGNTIVGGHNNQILESNYSFVGSGFHNSILAGSKNSILGGQYNTLNGSLSSIIGGSNNILGAGGSSSIIGGQYNTTNDIFSSIIGGENNTINKYGGIGNNIIGGGSQNYIFGKNSGILNGTQNSISAETASILGGSFNKLKNADNSAIVGGESNTIYGAGSSIIGGENNQNNSAISSIIGGRLNYIEGTNAVGSVIIGGEYNYIPSSASPLIKNSVIIGSHHITATTDNTLFTDIINARSLSGATTQMVVADVNGLLSVQAIPSVTGGTVSSGSTAIRNGLNTYTGGTAGNYTINISAATLNNLSVSGATSLASLSATTMISGSTNLYNVFVMDGQNVGTGANVYKATVGGFMRLRSLLGGQNTIVTQNTNEIVFSLSASPVFTSVSAQTISASTINSGTTNVDTLFARTNHTHSISAITDLNTTISLTGYKKTGTTTYERWYSQAVNSYGAVVTVAVAQNVIHAMPTVFERPVTLDRIAVNVTIKNSASTKMRLAIYNDSNLTPNSLVLDAGEVAQDTTGVKSITINQSLNPGLYWFCLQHNGTGNTTVTAAASTATAGILGHTSALATQPGQFLTKALTYSAYTSTFNLASVAVIAGNSLPLIFYRLT